MGLQPALSHYNYIQNQLVGAETKTAITNEFYLFPTTHFLLIIISPKIQQNIALMAPLTAGEVGTP